MTQLESIQEYKDKIFRETSLEQAQRTPSFFEALYAVEAKMVADELKKDVCHRCGQELKMGIGYSADEQGNEFDFEGAFGHNEDCSLAQM